MQKTLALAGSRTRISCLEGNYANRYTTDAQFKDFILKFLTLVFKFILFSNKLLFNFKKFFLVYNLILSIHTKF
jgi:hypothetical protein